MDGKNNIQRVLDEGRLIRHDWARTDEDGRQLLCLYTALLQDPRARPLGCPGHIAPKWLAYLLPWIDDAGTEEAWPSVVRRVAALAPRFASLPATAEWEVRALCVEEAKCHTSDAEVLAICDRVISLCRRRARGEDVPDEEFEATRSAAEAAARYAAWSACAAKSAEAAESAAWSAARYAAWSTESAAKYAARYATWSAARYAAEYAAWSACAAKSAGLAAKYAADRLTDNILTYLEVH